VQWGAFTSATTDFAAAKGFTDPAAGVIFKIAISSGRDINAYSFFPQVWADGFHGNRRGCARRLFGWIPRGTVAQEGEVLLSPNSRFVVSSLPYEKDGYTVVDLVEQHGAPWIS
jgi:hypothetical protein